VQAVAWLTTPGQLHNVLVLTSELTAHAGPHRSQIHEEECLLDVPDIQAT